MIFFNRLLLSTLLQQLFFHLYSSSQSTRSQKICNMVPNMWRYSVFTRNYVPRRILSLTILHKHCRLFWICSPVRTSHFGEYLVFELLTISKGVAMAFETLLYLPLFVMVMLFNYLHFWLYFFKNKFSSEIAEEQAVLLKMFSIFCTEIGYTK